MVAVNIIIGLLGLGVVVFVHELGHFLGARFTKIDVDAFSIGWGNPIYKKKINNVEYRIGMFPVGGYCKMKGDSDYKEAWENTRNGIKAEEGSFFAASPLSRIITCFLGPFFNFLFAILLLSILWGIGFEITTLDNRIIMASEITPGETFPADAAGLQTGDRIIKIDKEDIAFFHELRQNIGVNPDRMIDVTVEREGEIINLTVVPSLDKSTGAGIIGVSSWIDPVIGFVDEGGYAEKAGLRPMDVIISANGIPLSNTIDLMKVMDEYPELLALEYSRNGSIGKAQFTKEQYENGIGLTWAAISYRTPKLSPVSAVVKGVREGWKTLTISVKSLGLLFKGIDLTQAVSGPVRITYMMGEVATQGFGQGFGTGIRSIMEFIALISIALGIMNLLPLPIIDGGMIILYIVEWVRKKPAHPKAITVFQTCGMVIIFSLMIFALFGDILYFVRQ